MQEFNENPFKKDTPVTPFSNGSEFEYWRDNNCAECINYEDESESEEKAKGKLAYHLDYGMIDGTIPLWVAKGIGCDYNPLYQACDLWSSCIKKRKGDEPF